MAWFTGTFNLATVVGSVALFMMGAGIASPFALTSAVSVNPHAIGAASGLYGFVQMIYGALCTVLVETIAPGSITTVGAVMLGFGDRGPGSAVGRPARPTTRRSVMFIPSEPST